MHTQANSFTVKEFLGLSSERVFSPPMSIRGLVDLEASTTESISFAAGTVCGKWTQIPAASISSIEYQDTISCDDHSHPYVTLWLNKPSSPEAAAYASLANDAHRIISALLHVVEPQDAGAPDGGTTKDCIKKCAEDNKGNPMEYIKCTAKC